MLRGFGMTFDLHSGSNRYWFVDAEGVKRWADNNEPVESTKAETEVKE